MEEVYRVNDILDLEGREYQIVKKVASYYVLVSVDEPVDILVGEIKSGELIIIEDKNIIFSILK